MDINNGSNVADEKGVSPGNELPGAGNSSKLLSEIYDWIQCLVSALLICVLVFVFFVRMIDVVGHSMEPTLNDSDKVIISDLFYTPKSGDIVVLRLESFRKEPIVKRIIATEGQTVDIDFENGIVYVDGQALEEDYTAEATFTRLDFYGPVTVPEGKVFVMGDNRNNSTDSRDDRIGFIDERYIMGKVYWIVFPLKKFGSVY
ncbi:MAG: signal peptidase I [Oscillospiraceae bacterium]|jgi:signal peptidase I